jgi:transcriptional regulator with PAS, ATPase and Fis domain
MKNKKIYISWIATINDFNKDVRVQVDPETSPNYNFHRNCYKQEGYDEHIIICSEKEIDNPDDGNHINHQFSSLLGSLSNDFKNHKITPQYFNISKETKSLDVIHSKISELVLKNKESELHFSVSTGNRIMQLAWSLLHSTEKDINSKLVQLEKDDNEWNLQFLNIQKSNDTKSSIIKAEMEDKGEYCLTETLKPIYERASNLAQADTSKVSILINGESGTGKEHLANHIHALSSRREKPYYSINCGAFNDELLRSELFGYQKGSFTGANEDKKGYFELADGGTLFLDEIGDISPYMQQSLLRVLQSGEFQPVGSAENIKVDVKIISATNKNLKDLSDKGKFRLDLLYRLSTVKLELPPLRERGLKEINTLLEHFINFYPPEFKTKKITLNSKSLKRLQSYSYPGNVRELENIVLGLYAMYKQKIETEDLPEEVMLDLSKTSFREEEATKQHYIKTIKQLEGLSQNAICNALGVTINTFKDKVKKWNIK